MNKRAELLKEIVIEVNSYNGALESYEAREFDEEFFNVFFEGRPMEVARATFFGNIQSWADDYIRFNGYGNLESLSDWQYEEELLEGEKEIISEAEELADKDEYLKEKLEEYKELLKEEE